MRKILKVVVLAAGAFALAAPTVAEAQTTSCPISTVEEAYGNLSCAQECQEYAQSCCGVSGVADPVAVWVAPVCFCEPVCGSGGSSGGGGGGGWTDECAEDWDCVVIYGDWGWECLSVAGINECSYNGGFTSVDGHPD